MIKANLVPFPTFGDVVARQIKSIWKNVKEERRGLLKARVNQNDLIHIFSWPSLELRRVYHICLLVHKCLNNMAPENLLDEFHRAGEFHTYNTRARDLLRPPAARTSNYQSSFRINGVRTLNTL